MIARAREYCAGRPNVELHQTDGGLGFLEDARFDFVYSYIVFQHLPRKAYVQRYLRESARVLKDGGWLRVQVDGRSQQFFRRWIADSWSGVVFSARELARRLEREGFRVTELEGPGDAVPAGDRGEANVVSRASDGSYVVALSRRRSRLTTHDAYVMTTYLAPSASRNSFRISSGIATASARPDASAMSTWGRSGVSSQVSWRSRPASSGVALSP